MANTVNPFELLGCVAMSPGENGTLLIPVTVPRRLCKRRVRPAYKVYPKWLVYAVGVEHLALKVSASGTPAKAE